MSDPTIDRGSITDINFFGDDVSRYAHDCLHNSIHQAQVELLSAALIHILRTDLGTSYNLDRIDRPDIEVAA